VWKLHPASLQEESLDVRKVARGRRANHLADLRTDIDDLVNYRGLNAHRGRTPSGKRLSSILPGDDYTYTLVFIYDGEVSEKQQTSAVRHARRYDMEATVAVWPVSQQDFEGLVSDEASVESEQPDEDRKYSFLSLRCWSQTEDLADYAMGKGRPETIRPCDEPMTKSHIPEQHQAVLDLYRKPQADGDPAWSKKLEIATSYFAREWMVQCEFLAPGVVRSDVKSLQDWRGPIGLIQNAGRFIEGKRSFRDAYGWVLLLASLGEHIPEERRYYVERDPFFKPGIPAHHQWGRLDEDWTEDIAPSSPDTQDEPHAEAQAKPSVRRSPRWERPGRKGRNPISLTIWASSSRWGRFKDWLEVRVVTEIELNPARHCDISFHGAGRKIRTAGPSLPDSASARGIPC